MAQAFNPSTGEAGAGRFCDLESSPVYIVSSRTVSKSFIERSCLQKEREKEGGRGGSKKEKNK